MVLSNPAENKILIKNERLHTYNSNTKENFYWLRKTLTLCMYVIIPDI